jgi:SAM-dependent methyltransferase
MNLEKLVFLRNELKIALNTLVIEEEIDKNSQQLLNLTTDIDLKFKDEILSIIDVHQKINLSLEKNKKDLAILIQDVQRKIDSLSTKFFAENYQFECFYKDIEGIRQSRILQVLEEFEVNVVQRINLYSNWQYPALEIGCRDGVWTKHLVASDPLYISDIYEDFLHSAVAQFPNQYQDRVRKYLITDFYKINNLPNNQFGLIFSYNFFNYLSLDSIKQLLIQSLEWLRPGGKIIFTYNNADLPAAAAYAESFFMTYVPKHILVPMAESLGFEVVFSFDMQPAHSILELKKPGQLTSIRLSQTLGEIKTKNLT